jgi:hypothetical protein
VRKHTPVTSYDKVVEAVVFEAVVVLATDETDDTGKVVAVELPAAQHFNESESMRPPVVFNMVGGRAVTVAAVVVLATGETDDTGKVVAVELPAAQHFNENESTRPPVVFNMVGGRAVTVAAVVVLATGETDDTGRVVAVELPAAQHVERKDKYVHAFTWRVQHGRRHSSCVCSYSSVVGRVERQRGCICGACRIAGCTTSLTKVRKHTPVTSYDKVVEAVVFEAVVVLATDETDDTGRVVAVELPAAQHFNESESMRPPVVFNMVGGRAVTVAAVVVLATGETDDTGKVVAVELPAAQHVKQTSVLTHTPVAFNIVVESVVAFAATVVLSADFEGNVVALEALVELTPAHRVH